MKVLDIRHKITRDDVVAIYRSETQIDDDEFEGITKRELLEEITAIRTVNDTSQLAYLYFDKDEIEVLKEALIHPLQKNEDNAQEIDSLVHKLFLGKEEDGSYTIFDDFKAMIKKLMTLEPDDFWYEVQEVSQIIKKIIRTYSMVFYDKLIDLVKEVCPKTDKTHIRLCLNTHYLRYECDDHFKFDVYSIIKNEAKLKKISDALVYNRIIYEMDLCKYDWSVMEHCSRYGFWDNEKTRAYFKLISKYYKLDSEEYMKVVEDFKYDLLMFLGDPTSTKYISELNIADEEKEILYNAFIEAFENSITPGLNGHTICDLKRIMNEEKNALVEKHDYADNLEEFSDILFKCYEYLNQIYKRLVLFRIHEYRILPINVTGLLDECILEKPALLDDFIADNVYDLNEEQLKVVEGLKYTMEEDFIIADYKDGYMYLIDENDLVYVARGRYASIDPKNYRIGLGVRMILYPYKDTFIYSDGIQLASKKMQKKSRNAMKKLLANEHNYVRVGN